MELLKSIADLWLRQAELCTKAKEKHFGKTARKAWGYLNKSYRELYLERGDHETFPEVEPYYKIRIGKSREYVSLMLPYIHARVPTRTVAPRRPQIPQELVSLLDGANADMASATTNEKIQCFLMEWFLNYIPGEYGLYQEVRKMLPEAMVKGRGVLWHELTDGPTGIIPASYFDSVDNLLIDADCVQLRDAGFIMRKRRMQAWKIAQLYEIDVATVRGNYASHMNEAASRPEDADVCEFFEVWSRMGVGHRLVGASQEMKDQYDALESLGPNVFLAVMPGVDHPLNLPPEALIGPDAVQEAERRLDWPIPYYADMENPWPFSAMDFYPDQESPWATSPLEAALPLQEWLDHAYSFLMSRVKRSCKDLVITSEELSEAFNAAMEAGLDLEHVKFKGDPGTELEKLIHVVKFPEVNRDLPMVISMVERAFEQATGMTALMYGGEGQRQMRSGAEANIREAHTTSRPDDMADCMEQFMGRVGAKEAVAARLYVVPKTVAPLFGESRISPETNDFPEDSAETWGPLTMAWSSLVNTADEREAATEMAYSVEAGGGRRKNKQKQIADVQAITQGLQVAVQLANSGAVPQANTLLEFIGQAYDIPLGAAMWLPPEPGVTDVQNQGVSVSDVPEEAAAPAY